MLKIHGNQLYSITHNNKTRFFKKQELLEYSKDIDKIQDEFDMTDREIIRLQLELLRLEIKL